MSHNSNCFSFLHKSDNCSIKSKFLSHLLAHDLVVFWLFKPLLKLVFFFYIKLSIDAYAKD